MRHSPPTLLTGGHAPLAPNTPQLADPQTAQGGRCCQLLPGTGAEAQRGAGTCRGQQRREALEGRGARPGGPSPPPRPVGPGSPRALGAPWLLALTSASSLRCSRQARRPASGRSSSSTRATSSSTSGSTRTAPARSCPHPGSACPACTCAPWRRKPERPAPSRVPDPAGRDDQGPPSPGMGPWLLPRCLSPPPGHPTPSPQPPRLPAASSLGLAGAPHAAASPLPTLPVGAPLRAWAMADADPDPAVWPIHPAQAWGPYNCSRDLGFTTQLAGREGKHEGAALPGRVCRASLGPLGPWNPPRAGSSPGDPEAAELGEMAPWVTLRVSRCPWEWTPLPQLSWALGWFQAGLGGVACVCLCIGDRFSNKGPALLLFWSPASLPLLVQRSQAAAPHPAQLVGPQLR